MKALIRTGLLLSLLLFSGCGGGGGGGASFETSGSTTGSSVIACNGSNSSWTNLSSGDTVSTQESGTVLVWDHSQDDTKRVCVSSGSALVI